MKKSLPMSELQLLGNINYTNYKNPAYLFPNN